MNIESYVKVGDFYFKDSYNTILKKLKDYNYREFSPEENSRDHNQIYIGKFDLVINFEEDAESIKAFEFFKDSKEVFYKGVDLVNTGYDEVKNFITEYDENIVVGEDGFVSDALGIEIGRCLSDGKYTNEIESILVFSKSYLSEPETDLNELYKSIMGDEYELYD